MAQQRFFCSFLTKTLTKTHSPRSISQWLCEHWKHFVCCDFTHLNDCLHVVTLCSAFLLSRCVFSRSVSLITFPRVPFQETLLFFCTALGCSTFTMQNDVCAEWEMSRLLSNSSAEVGNFPLLHLESEFTRRSASARSASAHTRTEGELFSGVSDVLCGVVKPLNSECLHIHRPWPFQRGTRCEFNKS